ncbi:MAG: aminotransferase class IV, partial [Trueperaceae bacterium]|nr:aminotransferase class IV [Trueperaceae bacterium]
AFVTGTFGGLTPVAVVDGRGIGSGIPGPVTTRLTELYVAEKARYVRERQAVGSAES